MESNSCRRKKSVFTQTVRPGGYAFLDKGNYRYINGSECVVAIDENRDVIDVRFTRDVLPKLKAYAISETPAVFFTPEMSKGVYMYIIAYDAERDDSAPQEGSAAGDGI